MAKFGSQIWLQHFGFRAKRTYISDLLTSRKAQQRGTLGDLGSRLTDEALRNIHYYSNLSALSRFHKNAEVSVRQSVFESVEEIFRKAVIGRNGRKGRKTPDVHFTATA